MIPQTVTSRTDDRVLGSTRVVAALIIPFLVAAFVICICYPIPLTGCSRGRSCRG